MFFAKKRRWLLTLLLVGATAFTAWMVMRPGEPPQKIRRGKPLRARNDAAPKHHPLDDEEQQYRDLIKANPGHIQARAQLIFLLTMQCRTYEAEAQRQVLLRARMWEVDDLLSLAKPEDLVSTPELVESFRQDPENPRLMLARARLSLLTNEIDDATRWLDKTLAAAPNLVDAHAVRGLFLLENDPSEKSLTTWQRGLPTGADEHPDVWVVRGMLARTIKDQSGATRCFVEALRRFPNHRQATHQLSLTLAALGEEAQATALSHRVRHLDKLSRSIDDIYSRPDWDEPWLVSAQQLEALGRMPEAAAWYQAIARMGFGGISAQQKAVTLSSKLSADTPIINPSLHPLAKLDISKYPLPKFKDAAGSEQVVDSGRSREFRFVDVADRVGLNFAYFGAELPVLRVRRFSHLLGGGLGVLDFDQDGWPDLYCAQGAPQEGDSPVGDSAKIYRDRLFRNMGRSGVAGNFLDVTAQAGLGDQDLSHGVAVGDYNNDGFPDLWIGNAGENRLYRNNGDGTYSDATAEAGISGSAWTASCVVADFNGDGLPDLYEVNYLGGDQVQGTMCLGGEDCSPAAFRADQDRFFLNLGNGKFREQTKEAGIVAEDGKGLGIVVGDFDGDGVVSVFVANDGVPNHFYVNEAGRGDPPRFVDRATTLGVAYSGNGFSQGCMGIAIDDADGNGLMDMFVTNFFGESNTFYTDQPGKLFQDETQRAGLRLPSMPMVGFGTEFLDVDLDGDPDLVISNGQIDHAPGRKTEFQMRPQFFENRAGRFVERRGAELGGYFDRKLVGRCLVRVDFNRDGREDFAVSHLDAPVALLRNDTPDVGHFIAIQLRGVACDRDALGATVTTVTSGGRRRIRQLTAGDGFECSNQQQLIFGLGDATSVEKLVVRWPNGDEQIFSNVEVDRQFLVIQGNDELVRRPN